MLTERSQKLSLAEAAQVSGMSLSWWRKKVFRGEVPYYKIGRRILVDTSDIELLFRKNRVEPEAGPLHKESAR